MNPQVFISYSQKDKFYANRLVANIKWHGFRIWIDDRIDFGSKWPAEIEKNLNLCSVVVVILTSNSKKSEWVQNEIIYSQAKGKAIFPLLLEGEIWLPLAATQCTDVRGGKLPPDEFYETLRQTLKNENPWAKSSSEEWKGLNKPDKTKTETFEKLRKAWNLKGRDEKK